jgi:peroxiredoxin
MKKIWLVLAIGIWSCGNKYGGKKLEVSGTIRNSSAKTVYLEEIPFTGSAPVIIDSAEIAKDGSFLLETNTKEEGLFSIRTSQSIYPTALVISDANKITVQADAANQDEPYTVKGSDASQALLEYDRNLSHRAISIFQMSAALDSMAKKRIEDSTAKRKYTQIEKEVADMKTYALDFIQKSKSPALSLYALDSYQSMMSNLGIKGFNATESSEIVNKASDKFPGSKSIAEAKKRLRPSKAVDFSMPDVNGKPVSLSSFKGKYVLVDFWASWCQPCRKENPNVVKAYNQFKDKNFTILGVSLDQKREAWLEAIKQDGLVWTQISDLQYWNSKAVELYRFNSIPYNILLDPDGNIIAEDLQGGELVRKLSEVLK